MVFSIVEFAILPAKHAMVQNKTTALNVIQIKIEIIIIVTQFLGNASIYKIFN